MDRRALFSDVDDTLLCHDLSQFPKKNRITIHCGGRTFEGVPHQKNINTLIKFYRLGYDVYVWSKTGKSWAEAVVEKLGLGQYVTACLQKPDFLLDDRGVEEWIGVRIWRSPLGEGLEHSERSGKKS